MKFFIYIITLFLIINNTMHAQETKEEQVKVAYVYNFLQNISWQNENKIAKYRLLVASKNETLKNMFLMLASRKQLKNKNLEVLIYEENKNYKNIQAIYIGTSFDEIYEKVFFEYEKENTLFISDGYEDKKQVMINLIKDETKITFEINKANILNRSLEISPNLILLGGTEIDVAKLYKTSQDALKEQKETISSLNQKIETKNTELNSKISSIEEQKILITKQTKNIKNYDSHGGIGGGAVAAGLRGILEAGRIIDGTAEDPEERRKRIEAQENASNLGAVIGLAVGILTAVADSDEDMTAEENDEPTIKM